MKSDNIARFRRMLSNERSFDKLFCDVKSSKGFDFYYNNSFSEDSLFNHAVLSEQVLVDLDAKDRDAIISVLEAVKAESRSRNLPSTIFLEKVWKNSDLIETNAIEEGFVISGSMSILSKGVTRNSAADFQDVRISETDDYRLWNETFMRAFSIDSKWKDELTRRLQLISANQHTSLFLAVDGRSNALGCMLLHISPPDLMGMYCVGTVPERRNQGVASRMIGVADDFAASAGCKELTLQTIVSDGTTRLYLSHGYRTEFDRDVLQLR